MLFFAIMHAAHPLETLRSARRVPGAGIEYEF